jgi:signal transduction histidine kinase
MDSDSQDCPELVPHLHLDGLLSERHAPFQAVLDARDRIQGLLEAVVAIGSGLDIESTLRRIVETAVTLVDATYGALGVIGDGNRIAEFIPVGLSEEEIARINHWPEGRGLLGLLIDEPRPLRLASIASHPSSSGFPAGHPPMSSFLGVPVQVRDEVFGNLYLTGKRGADEFTEDDEAVVLALGAAAGIAVENARLYEAARRDQRWVQASAEVATALLSGAGPGDVLADITRKALELSGADVALLALPEEQEPRRLTLAFTEGDGAAAVRGLTVPADETLSGQVLTSGNPVASADFAADARTAPAVRAALSHLGPAMLFPLGAPGKEHGVFTIGRRHGAEPFRQKEIGLAFSFAVQAGVALELAAGRADAERLLLYEDRDRIARDLHDHVIQRLYATGMALQGTLPIVTRPEAVTKVSDAVEAVDETIKEIRNAIFSLQARADGGALSLREDIATLVDEMTPMLGFAPSLRLGAGLRADTGKELTESVLASVREALSNAARHAAATRVDIVLDTDDDGTFVVLVTDDGTGIPPDAARSGLRNLAARAANLGGGLRVEQAYPGRARPGTRLEWRVPAG